jgi:hypothetical protein
MHPVQAIRASLTVFALRSNRQSASTTTIKRPSLRRHFPSPSSTFSLYSHLSVCAALAGTNCSHWASASHLVRHFSNLRSSPTLHCLASSLSFYPYAHCAVQLKLILSPHPRMAARPLSILLFSRALLRTLASRLSPLQALPPSLVRCLLILCQWQLRLRGETRYLFA